MRCRAQAPEAAPSGLASDAGTLATDTSGMQVVLGYSASMVPTAQDFERSLSSMANIKTTVTFVAEDVTLQNAALLERLAKVSLYRPI